jgi:hypothetical protein
MTTLAANARKFRDWRSYFEGMYVNAVKAATGAFLSFAGTNTAEAIAPVALENVGMNWQQAIITAASVLVIEVVRYINAKPLPDSVQDPEELKP